MFSPDHPIASIVRGASLFNSEAETSAATAGVIGWLSEFGAVVIPTVGFFIRSQVFLQRSHGSLRGPGTLWECHKRQRRLGFSEEEAEKFADRLGNLGVLVYVSCTESAKTLWAREVLRHTGAQEVATLEERMTTAATA